MSKAVGQVKATRDEPDLAVPSVRTRGGTPPSGQRGLGKVPTGIEGFDEITLGGLPRGRPTLICGAAGCGKTLFGLEFLVGGTSQFGEPGVFVAFEETENELAENVRSLGFDLEGLVAEKRLIIDYVHIDREPVEETGSFDLDGLFIRLGRSIDEIGARRVAIDTLETLFASLPNPAVLRAEIRRLFQWLKDRGITAVITAEKGEGTLTRHGLEEYVSDCVVVLDHRVVDQVSTRRLRVMKYRGSYHGTNEYPFLIGERGISVLPISSNGLDHEASMERVSTGVPALDAMFGGGGYYRGSIVLISGSAGSGKTSLAAHFAHANAQAGKRCLYFAFEESSAQITRNLRSIGLDLGPLIEQGNLRFHSCRPTAHGLEQHLVLMHKLIEEFRPDAVVVDPISNLMTVAPNLAVRLMLTRLIDHLKKLQITAFFTNFTQAGAPSLEMTDVGVSSLVDTWIMVRELESNGERTRALSILKSRGMAHSNQVREFLLTDRGIDLVDVYLGPEGILTGAARVAREAQTRVETALRGRELERRRRTVDRLRATLDARIATLRDQLDAAVEELEEEVRLEHLRENTRVSDQAEMAQARTVDLSRHAPIAPKPNGKGRRDA
jgi:circadian clock protein KaiC